MIKSVFVGLSLPVENYKKLGEVGANHLIVWLDSITSQKWPLLQKTGCELGISFSAFEKEDCPLDPLAKDKLREKIKRALKWRPREIWLDHFRFDGYWESTFAKAPVDKGYLVADTHKPCKWCRDKNRVKIIDDIAKEIKKLVRNKTKVGYFAVPYHLNRQTKLVSELGQNHSILGKIFDMASPMLYHRMIRKPVSYISKYVKYMHKLTQKPVLPIIQIKDMPDLPAGRQGDLQDKLSWNEIKAAYNEAKKKPSVGVSIFMWEHAVEKNKVGLIKELLSSK